MLPHVALWAYLVFSSCLGVGELHSASVAVQSTTPSESVPATKAPQGNDTANAASQVMPVSRGTSVGARSVNHKANAAKLSSPPDKPSGSPVPEPKIFALVGIGLLILSLLRRRVARHQG